MFQNEFQNKKASNLECESETQKKREDELFLKVLGGWNEKGRIFGLGAAAHSYYDRSKYEERNVELVAKTDDQKKELDQTKQELGETKQGIVET
ncbi:NADPH-dependent 7-cyano-7-deazaguanine reductase [Bienertia sinuspersici]